jgi:hypothetical protein
MIEVENWKYNFDEKLDCWRDDLIWNNSGYNVN